MFSINQAQEGMPLLRGQTLHSTMFSINQTIMLYRQQAGILYIPLCFLLIRPVYTGERNADSLYIPLCFLLIFSQKYLHR